jgi:phosphopantetheine--protein transferase-like protein
MSQTDQLRESVARILMCTPGELAPETPLRSLNNSLGDAKLRASLRRSGLSLPSGPVPATYGELEGKILGTETRVMAQNTLARQAAPAAGAFGGLAVGLDLENVSALPVTADFWEHEFYRQTFGKSEIAYAVAQAEPRMHLAGFWCAKEALRKCDPSFGNTPFSSTVVAHGPGGEPYLVLETTETKARLAQALSITHTGDTACAVVIAATSAPAVAPATTAPAAVRAVEAPRRSSMGLLSVVLMLLIAAGIFVTFQVLK